MLNAPSCCVRLHKNILYQVSHETGVEYMRVSDWWSFEAVVQTHSDTQNISCVYSLRWLPSTDIWSLAHTTTLLDYITPQSLTDAVTVWGNLGRFFFLHDKHRTKVTLLLHVFTVETESDPNVCRALSLIVCWTKPETHYYIQTLPPW